MKEKLIRQFTCMLHPIQAAGDLIILILMLLNTFCCVPYFPLLDALCIRIGIYAGRAYSQTTL